MKDDSLGLTRRRRHGAAEIARIVRTYQAGSVTQRQLATEHGISVGTLQNWLRRHRTDQGTEGEWVEVVAGPPVAAGRYRIEFPKGAVLVLTEDWREERVRVLAQILAGV